MTATPQPPPTSPQAHATPRPSPAVRALAVAAHRLARQARIPLRPPTGTEPNRGTGALRAWSCGGRSRRPPALLLVSDPRRLPDPIAAARHLPRGSGVLLRPYGLPTDQRRARVRPLRQLAARRGLWLLVAVGGPWPPERSSRSLASLPPLPPEVPAPSRSGPGPGLHLPEGLARHGLLARLLLWRRQAPGRRLTMAAHGGAALVRARRLRVDAALLSPAFPTRSHPGAPTLGAVRMAGLLRAIAQTHRPAVLALGGVRATTAPRLVAAGAGVLAGLAAIDGLADPTPPPPQKDEIGGPAAAGMEKPRPPRYG